MHYEYPQWAGWPGDRTALVAEVGVNHGGDEELAWDMIQAAHRHGADFVKLQTFVMEKFLHPCLPYYDDTAGVSLAAEAQRRLWSRARGEGIRLMTTAFDLESLGVAEDHDPPAHKVASMDLTNTPLLRGVARTGRPVLLSCGMANLDEIERAVRLIEDAGNRRILLLHCVSDYPAAPGDLNLSMMDYFGRTFRRPVGLSDHSLGIDSARIAASLGAAVIEKHFTTDPGLLKTIPQGDHDISITPRDLGELRSFCESVAEMIGQAPRPVTEGEREKRTSCRRSIYASRDIAAGQVLSEDNMVCLRPVQGTPAESWDELSGAVAVRSIGKLEPIRIVDVGR